MSSYMTRLALPRPNLTRLWRRPCWLLCRCTASDPVSRRASAAASAVRTNPRARFKRCKRRTYYCTAGRGTGAHPCVRSRVHENTLEQLASHQSSWAHSSPQEQTQQLLCSGESQVDPSSPMERCGVAIASSQYRCRWQGCIREPSRSHTLQVGFSKTRL